MQHPVFAATAFWLRFVLAPLCLLLLFSGESLAAQAGQRTSTAGFVVRYPEELASAGGDRVDAKLSALRRMKEQRVLESAAKDLNRVIRLPKSVQMTFAVCDQPNASYDPSTRRIVICAELVQKVAARQLKTARGLAQLEPEEDPAVFLDEVWPRTASSINTVLFHEAAHAVIHLLDLPVTGRSEDAADQLGFLLEVAAWRMGSRTSNPIEGSSFWEGMDDSEKFDERTAANLHSMSKQRAHNFTCWNYGRALTNEMADEAPHYKGAVLGYGRKFLPEHRLESCEWEYAELRRSWQRLLGGNLRFGK